MSDTRPRTEDHFAEIPLDFRVVQEAVKRNHHRTPFLLLDPDLIRTKLQRFRAAMPKVYLYYAVKANSHPAVLGLMAAEHIGFEIASIGELDALLELGVPAHEIHYNNPIKSRDYLEYAARAGVRWYIVDGVDELRKVIGVKRDAKLCLRIETQNLGSDWPLTGKFGATLTETSDIIDEARKLRADLAGVAFHVGSQCRNLENWRIGIENAKLAFSMMRKRGLEPRLLNIGGGYPVRYLKPIPSIERIGATVTSAVADLSPDVRVMAEPGRFLVSDCAWLVSRVIGTATRRGTRWVYLDTGVYHGLMESIEGLEYAMRTERSGAEIPCTLAGPTCDSFDVVARDKMLPQDLREGDYVYFPNAGAYTLGYSTEFNGFPRPDTVVMQHA
ncbi:MAG: type III PLP-dependent enzyme [Betaproteobacteria bacterium]|nr:type III PLP-dependent enzyme [Betaproteobacteria bacterium]